VIKIPVKFFQNKWDCKINVMLMRKLIMLKATSQKELNVIFLIASTILLSCAGNMSETIYDESAGVNGSFEIINSGLPVNWLIYTPETIPTGDYDLIIDTTDYIDGSKSLRFLVRECSGTGGWHSPGLCKEYEAIPGEEYNISFSVKNDGCEFIVNVGGVSAFEGEYEIIVKSKDTIETWKQFEYQYTMPSEGKFDRLRFELNILHPGNFLIDDIKIEGINHKSVIPTTR